MSRTLKLTIAYDGTDFAGWQRQAATVRTVQATVEDALVPIEGARVVLTGAGRTDSGVHAAGQVASVTLGSAIPTNQLQRALNATLPTDVRIMELQEVAPGFNAQFDARQKTYHYWLQPGGVLRPQIRRYVWHVPQPVDLEAMNAAAAALIGTHDFAAFQAAGSDVHTTVRELLASRVMRVMRLSATPFGARLLGPDTTPDDVVVGPGISLVHQAALLCYEVRGTGFLRHMVRNIVGTLVEIGRGRRPVSDMTATLASRNRSRAAATAPPQGLTLWSVEY